jgi:alanine racemase
MSLIAYSIAEIAKMVEGKLFSSSPEDTIEQLLIDSRKAYTHKNTLFFAIDGVRNNGHHFILTSIKKGIKNFVVSDPSVITESANFILVENTLSALQLLATQHRKKYQLPIIGITGSNGKTIVKEWLYQLLKDSFLITRSPKSYNSQVGVPLSVWLLNSETELAIFEAGVSTSEEMCSIQPIISPSIGIFTNIGSAHQEGFNSREEKIKEKAILFKNAEKIIYCKDYELIDLHLTAEFEEQKRFNWSYSNPKADVTILEQTTTDKSTTIKFTYKGSETTYSIPHIDRASIENSIHCICTLIVLNQLTTSIISNTKNLTPVSMRLELKEGINQSIIINDSYNSDISSLKVALDFLNQQHDSKTLILSDITNSNQDNEELYQEIATIINGYQLNKFIGIGPNLFKTSKLYNAKEKILYTSTREFLDDLKNENFNNEAILIKGARNFGFEKIANQLELKAHETELEIDLRAMVGNLNYYKSIVKKSTKIMAMVKAFAYGSGNSEIANILQYQRIDYLAVAYADEGVELREAGITSPIMVMNPEKNSFAAILKYNLEPEIYSFSVLGQFINLLENNFENPQLPFPVHIKVDSGMHRLGFTPQEVNQLSYVLNSCKSSIRVKSIFSHLAASDNSNEKVFTLKQIEILSNFHKSIERDLGYTTMKHILNSGGIENYPDAQFDMVRLGIGLYGITSNPETKQHLNPVGTLTSTISQIKLVEEGDTIGYNRKGIAASATRIAVIAIGYADGIDRNLGNGNYHFLINEQQAPIIGDICMDMCMVDVTNINCQAGDKVIIFGAQHPIESMAKQLNTITYEILTGISRRVKRVYYQE